MMSRAGKEDLDAANLIIIKQQQKYIENRAGNKGKRYSLQAARLTAHKTQEKH